MTAFLPVCSKILNALQKRKCIHMLEIIILLENMEGMYVETQNLDFLENIMVFFRFFFFFLFFFLIPNVL